RYLGKNFPKLLIVELADLRTEKDFCRPARCCKTALAMHQLRQLLGQPSLTFTLLGLGGPGCIQRFDLRLRQIRQESQTFAGISIVDIDPILIKLIGAGSLAGEPNRAALGLAHLAAIALREQRIRKPIKLRAFHAPSQIDSCSNVSPLITA